MNKVPKKRHHADLLALSLLVGVFGAAFVVLLVITGFADRMQTAMSSVQRYESLETYPGRPVAFHIASASDVPLNYSLLLSDSDNDLYAVIIMHLSTDRNSLTMVVLPPNLSADPDASGPSEQMTLGAAFVADPQLIWRAVEELTETRIDHQMIILTDKLAGVIRAMDGVSIASLGDEPVEASKAYGWVASSLNKEERAERVAEVIKSVLVRFSVQDAVVDPVAFDQVLQQLTHCLKVDQDLSYSELESIILELRVKPDEIQTIFVPVASVALNPTIAEIEEGLIVSDEIETIPGEIYLEVPVAEPPGFGRAELREAFHTDNFSGLPLR